MRQAIVAGTLVLAACASGPIAESPAVAVEETRSRVTVVRLGEPVDVVIQNSYTPRTTIRVTLLESTRGEEAFQRVLNWTRFSRPPPEGYEIVLGRFLVEVLDREEPDTPFQLLGFDFRSVSGAGRLHPTYALCCADPPLQNSGFVGESWEGWRAFLAEIEDPGTLVVYRRDRPEAVWFALR